MLLKSITLQNIRSYTQITLPLEEGITLLSGDIGSGKSTILLSIEFALFGLIKNELTGSTLLRKGTNNGFVELDLVLEQKKISIRRVLKQTKNGIVQDASHIIIDGVKKEVSPVELKSIIFGYCGYPTELLNKKNLIFRYTVYTPQEEMKRIILEEKEERLNTLRRAFGIDKYKRIRENTTVLQKKVRDECKELQGFLVDTEEKKKTLLTYQEELKHLQEQLTPLQVNKKEKETVKQQLKHQIEEKKVLFQQEQEYLQKITRLDAELKEIISQRESNNTHLQKIKQEQDQIKLPEKPEHSEEEIEREIKTLEQNIKDINTKEAARIEKISFLTQQIERITQGLKDEKEYRQKLNNVKKELTELEQKKSKKESAKTQYDQKTKEKIIIEKNAMTVQEKKESSLKLIKKMQDMRECPYCLQQVSESHRAEIVKREGQLLEELEKKESSILEQQKHLEEAVSLAKNLVESLEAADVTYEQAIAKSRILENELTKTTEATKELTTAKEDLQKATNENHTVPLKELENELSIKKQQIKVIQQYSSQSRILAEKQAIYSSIEQRNNLLKERVITINKQKMELHTHIPKVSVKDTIQKLETDYQNNEEELKKIEISISTTTTKQESMLMMEKTLTEELQKKKKAQETLQKKMQFKHWIEKAFLPLMSIIEKNILSSIYHEFNEHFKEWFSMLIDDDLLQAKLNDEFTPEIEQNGYDGEITNLSGGEKTALALAYRLALNKVINDVTAQITTKSLIILDEPTDGFSEQQLDKMRDVLNRLSMKQIIVVSHEQKIESYVEHIIRISKQQHVSQAY